VYLSLWHGFNAALALSVASLVCGALAFASWSAVRRAHLRWEKFLGWGPAHGYTLALLSLNWLARAQTRFIQNGYLRAYIITIVVATIGLAGTTLLMKEGLQGPATDMSVRFYEVALAALILMSGYVALRSRSRLAAIAALGVIGFCVALMYLFFGAPDLAMTQVLVDTLTVILFVLVFYHLPRFIRLSSTLARARDVVISVTFGALMTTLVLMANNLQFHESISPYFVEQSLPKGHGRNVVNVILVDFRALDTLGEITVLALAAIGVYSLLKLRLQENAPPAATPAEAGGGA
jgi:multicomponent Na+:H+ antiporter subunit A